MTERKFLGGLEPNKPISEMTDEEIDAFADELAGIMFANHEADSDT